MAKGVLAAPAHHGRGGEDVLPVLQLGPRPDALLRPLAGVQAGDRVVPVLRWDKHRQFPKRTVTFFFALPE